MMKLLSPEDCAEALAVSRSTVLRMIVDGALPAICLRSGRRKKIWRVREEILEKWILDKEKKTARNVTKLNNVDNMTNVTAKISEPTSPERAQSNREARVALACEADAR